MVTRSQPFNIARQRARGWPLVAAVALLALIPLSGCNGPAEATGPSTTATVQSASTTPSSTPTPTAKPVYKPADASGPAQNVPVPVKPAIADEFSKEGIEAFAKYWYATLDYAYESGDLGPLAAITGPDCVTCNEAKATIAKWHSDGRWISNGGIDVSATQSDFKELPGGLYQSVVQLKLLSVSFYGTDGQLVTTKPDSGLLGDLVEATYADNVWKAQNVEHMFGS